MFSNKAWSATAKLIGFVFLALLFTVFLPSVFSGQKTLNPIALSFGPLTVRWYGLLIASGAFIAYLLVDAESRRTKVNQGQMEFVVFLVLVLGLIGARIGFVIQNIPYFRQFPVEALKIYHGGLSIHGALIGGIIALAIVAKNTKTSFYRTANILAPPVLLAIAIGRWGNFFNQEIIGKPANILWKMYVSPINRPDGFESFNFFHPVFLYESLALALVYYMYWRYLRDRDIGLIFTLCAYCLVRIIVEFWRIDYKPIILKMDLAQLVSFAIILIVAIVCFVIKKAHKGRKLKTK